MHDEIAFFQIGEINVQRGTRGLRVRRFQPARTLDFVAAKNFRVGDDDQFRLVTNKSARERAEMNLQAAVSSAIETVIRSRFPETAAARRRCCKKRGPHNPAATSDEVAGKIRAAAPRRFAAPARARPADETRRANQIAGLRIADCGFASAVSASSEISREVKLPRLNSIKKSGHEMKNGSSFGICDS